MKSIKKAVVFSASLIIIIIIIIVIIIFKMNPAFHKGIVPADVQSEIIIQRDKKGRHRY